MKTDFRDSWPVCHRCAQTERLRRGEVDEVRPVHWVWLTLLFGLFVLGGAVSDILSYWGL